MWNPEEPVVDHVDGDTRLLEGHVADQRLVAPVLGFHLHEEELADDRVETRDADHDRPADLAAHRNAGNTRSANSRAGSRVSRPKNSITKSVQPRAVWRRMRSITCAGVPQMPCASRPAPMCPP